MTQGGGCGGCEDMGKGGCRCPHHMMFPFLVVAFGATFLLGAFNVIDGETVNVIWPIIVVLAGLKKMFARMCKCC